MSSPSIKGTPSSVTTGSQSSVTSGSQSSVKGTIKKKNPIRRFIDNVKKFLREMKKPNKKEFKEILRGHLMGVLLLGVFAYIIKVIHIPINNMIAGSNK